MSNDNDEIDKIRNFIVDDYRSILRRYPSTDELEKSIGDISIGRMTKEDFLETLIISEEHKNIIENGGNDGDGIEKLNIGCGKDKRCGYKNVDIRKDIGADMILDLEKVPYSEFEDKSIDKILASDIIEHFSFNSVDDIVREWYRILKIGGILVVRTPDFDEIVRWKGEALTEEKRKEGNRWKYLSYHIYGAQDYIENYHKLIFTKEELKSFLEHIGFKVENIYNRGLNMICESVKVR